MIKLTKLLNELRTDENVISLQLNEKLDCETYTYLGESVNINDTYEIEQTGNAWYNFTDKCGIIHFQRLLHDGKHYDIKFGFIHPKSHKPCYDKPNIVNKQKYDYKIFNTQSKILVDILIPYFFNNTTNEPLRLPFIDHARYRLFKIVLNNTKVDTKYNIEYKPTENTIAISND